MREAGLSLSSTRPAWSRPQFPADLQAQWQDRLGSIIDPWGDPEAEREVEEFRKLQQLTRSWGRHVRLQDCDFRSGTIWEGCGDNDELAEEIRTLRFREFRGNVPDKDPPAEPEQKRRHLVEALMYILLFGPDFIDPGRRITEFKPIYPNIAY